MKVAVFSTLALLAVCGLALADLDYDSYSGSYGGYGSYGIGGYGGGYGGYGGGVSYIPMPVGGKGGNSGSGIFGSCKYTFYFI